MSSYKQIVSGPGELTRSKQCQHQLDMLKVLYGSTTDQDRLNIGPALDEAIATTDYLLSSSTPHKVSNMGRQTFVFVHGAWHGSWAFDALISRLQRAGHVALAIDTLGRAGDPQDAAGITLQKHAQHIASICQAQVRPVVLVGHSLGGIMITQAAEIAPSAIRKLVYLSAFLPTNGQAAIDLVPPYVPDWLDPQPPYMYIKHSTDLKHFFYGDLPDSYVDRAKVMLVPEPIATFVTPVSTTSERWGRVPRDYISFTDDVAILPETQDAMVAASPCRKVYSFEGSHTYWLKDPGGVGNALLEEFEQTDDPTPPPEDGPMLGYEPA